MSDPPLTSAQRAFLAQMETPGSVLYGIFGWMSDSIMLARMRPVFMDLIALSLEVNCARQIPGGEQYGDPCGQCEGCRLHSIVERLEVTTKP